MPIRAGLSVFVTRLHEDSMRGKSTRPRGSPRLSGSHVLVAHASYLAVARRRVSPYLLADVFRPTCSMVCSPYLDGFRPDPIGWQVRWLVNSGTAASFCLTIFTGFNFDLILSSLLVRRVL